MTNWWQVVSTKHPKWVIVPAAILMLILGVYGLGVFGSLTNSTAMNANGTESAEATKLIEEKFGAAPNSQVVLFTRVDESLGDAESDKFQAEVGRLLEPLQEEASSIVSYATTHSDNFLSRDKKMSYAIVNIEGEHKDIYEKLRSYADNADQSKFKISIGGEAALLSETNKIVATQLGAIELISLPILLLLLIYFFRSVVASLVPLGIAICTVLGAFAIARLLAGFIDIDNYAVNVITFLGLGLSIDYALLSVNRFREELPGGVEHAVKTMVATAGHTIVFSGITVIACLLSLLVFPFDIMHSIAIGGAAAVATAMATTYILLPSVLRLIGNRIDKGEIGVKQRDRIAKAQRNLWGRMAHATTSHPIVTLCAGIGVVLLAILPVLKFQPGELDYQWLARGAESQEVYRVMSEDFPSSNPDVTALLVMSGAIDRSDQIDASCEMTTRLARVAGVESVISATPISAQLSCSAIQMMDATDKVTPELQTVMDSYMTAGALKFDVILKAADMEGTEKILDDLRNVDTPQGELLLTGLEAQFNDSNRTYYKYAPYAVAIIGVSMIVLLSFALKSIVVPLQAVIINSISLAISLAAIVGVFQLGWFSGLTGWPSVDGIVLAAPILVAAIAFGLAMDYSVFLYSRMREVYDATGDSLEAVRQGIVKTGPIITAAAVALFVVVVGFLSSSVLFLQIIGLGMSIAVIVDAFFVRLVLVPAIMTLIGKHSWR